MFSLWVSSLIYDFNFWGVEKWRVVTCKVEEYVNGSGEEKEGASWKRGFILFFKISTFWYR